MKATLEFNLPDDRQDYDVANAGMQMWHVLWDYKEYLHSLVKYRPNSRSDETQTVLQIAYDVLLDQLADYHVNLDMVE
jgi:hypothetical protein